MEQSKMDLFIRDLFHSFVLLFSFSVSLSLSIVMFSSLSPRFCWLSKRAIDNCNDSIWSTRSALFWLRLNLVCEKQWPQANRPNVSSSLLLLPRTHLVFSNKWVEMNAAKLKSASNTEYNHRNWPKNNKWMNKQCSCADHFMRSNFLVLIIYLSAVTIVSIWQIYGPEQNYPAQNSCSPIARR